MCPQVSAQFCVFFTLTKSIIKIYSQFSSLDQLFSYRIILVPLPTSFATTLEGRKLKNMFTFATNLFCSNAILASSPNFGWKIQQIRLQEGWLMWIPPKSGCFRVFQGVLVAYLGGHQSFYDMGLKYQNFSFLNVVKNAMHLKI